MLCNFSSILPAKLHSVPYIPFCIIHIPLHIFHSVFYFPLHIPFCVMHSVPHIPFCKINIYIPFHRYLFFIDWQKGSGSSSSTSAVIKRAELDGSDLKTIVHSDDAGTPRDLVVDYQGAYYRVIRWRLLLIGACIRGCLFLMGTYIINPNHDGAYY